VDPVPRRLVEEEAESELAAVVIGLAEVNRIAAALEEVFEHVRDGKREATVRRAGAPAPR
jgi:hypothetical protein